MRGNTRIGKDRDRQRDVCTFIEKKLYRNIGINVNQMGFFRASERTTKYHKKNIELGQRKTLIKKTNKMFFLHSPRIHVKLRVFGILRREKRPFAHLPHATT